jgi:signal transduction histidine kinase
VLGDDRLLGRAVCNLIDNAIKYSPAGSPLALALVRHDDKFVLRVQDQGPGIPAELRERVFEPFFREPRARVERPGHGLGLPLARALARAHGGEVVWVNGSVPGAAFELTLPAADPGISGGPAAPAGPQPRSPGARALS